MKQLLLLLLLQSLLLPFSLFAQGKLNSNLFVTKYPNGKIKSEAYLVDGLPDGLTVTYDEEGNQILRQLYKKGILSVEKEYYKSGKLLRDTDFDEDGQIDGDNKFYYESGRLKVREKYRHGKMHGVERRYNEDGSVIVNVVWKAGEVKAGKCANGKKLDAEELKGWKESRLVDCSKVSKDDNANGEYEKLLKELGEK